MAVKIPRALTIAGLDSGGGAGITADLKTFHALGVYGMVALTAVTAQNTMGVRAVQEVDPSIVEAQIDAVAEDIGVDAAKTGMLSSSPIMEAVARAVSRWGFPLVVDPVMYAKSGDPLIRPEAMETLKRVIIPLAKVVTPNAPEASHLVGFPIKTLDDARKAAKAIAEELHPEVVIVKGGHLGGEESIDIVYFRDNGKYMELRAPRIETKNTHGTGCSFSAAIAAGLAKGMSVEDSIRQAKEFITMAIRYSLPLGHGHGPVNPMSWIEIKAYRGEALDDALAAVDRLRDIYDKQDISHVLFIKPMPYPYSSDATVIQVSRTKAGGLEVGRLGINDLPDYIAHIISAYTTPLAMVKFKGGGLPIAIKPTLSTTSKDLVDSVRQYVLKHGNLPNLINITDTGEALVPGGSLTDIAGKLRNLLSG